jgi:hypothetical protein
MRWIALGAAAAGLLATASLAGATTNHTIQVDGSCADWAADEQLTTATAGDRVGITWDGSNVFVASWGLPFNDRLVVGFDLDRGTDDGSNVSYGGVSFPATGQPDYVYELYLGFPGADLFSTRHGNGFSTVSAYPPIQYSWSASTCNSQPFVDISFPRTMFSGGDVSGLTPADDVGVYAWLEDGNQTTVYASMPASNPTGATPKTFASQAYCPSTDAARSPNVFCAGTPTAAILTAFRAHGRTLTWRTGAELGIVGFELRRDGRLLRTRQLRVRSRPGGSTYRYVDTGAHVGVHHLYRLFAIQADGSRRFLGAARS